MKSLQIIEHQNQRVLTTQQIAESYGWNYKLPSAFKVVYAIENSRGLIKIGITKSPYSRIAGIRTISGLDIERAYISIPCTNSRDIEKKVHASLDDSRELGEWFNAKFEDVCKIIEKQNFSKEIPKQKSSINLIEYFNPRRF